jgi:hypothetical protein
LPPYSPELNPDELVWNTLKQNIGRKNVSGPDDLQQKMFLASLRFQNLPHYLTPTYPRAVPQLDRHRIHESKTSTGVNRKRNFPMTTQGNSF